MAPKKISIVTLGCLKNTADTSNLARLLKARGHEIVADAADADAIVVHTCSFIEAAKKESIDTILQASRMKTEGKKLIVTGCLVQQHGEEIFKDLPEVDAFLGTGQLAQVADLLEKPRARFMDRANPGGFMDPDSTQPRDTTGPTGILRLSEGCSHPCTFCVIPRLRGGVQSRSEETILSEARELAGRGVEEFSVIAQDTGDWGRERQSREQKAESRKRLPELLRKISQINGVRWIRLMYMHPASFTDDLLAVLAEQPDKFPYLDMPFQHIDSDVLSQMQRKTDEASLRQLLARIKGKAPRLTLRTTFIVGFPGETAVQFKRLISFIQEGWFDYLGAFAYSKEEGTSAAKRSDQIPDKLKKDRLTTLANTYYDIAHAKAQVRLGTTETILLEETEGDTVLGRTRREAPEIDAIVRLPQKIARGGRFVTAKLMAYDAYEFTANPV
jgi:ribosomal protein S12 methylthiotransferase